MNDLIELHQNEIENLKQGIADMEEKIQYQSEERLRDVYEMLDSCQTRVSRAVIVRLRITICYFRFLEWNTSSINISSNWSILIPWKTPMLEL